MQTPAHWWKHRQWACEHQNWTEEGAMEEGGLDWRIVFLCFVQYALGNILLGNLGSWYSWCTIMHHSKLQKMFRNDLSNMREFTVLIWPSYSPNLASLKCAAQSVIQGSSNSQSYILQHIFRWLCPLSRQSHFGVTRWTLVNVTADRHK